MADDFTLHLSRLEEMGEWKTADGRAFPGPLMSSVIQWLDGKFAAMAMESGAEELRIPPLIGRLVLERAGYFESFPQASAPWDSRAEGLPPAVCYHCHARLASARLQGPRIWTCVAVCRRDEEGLEWGRLQIFSMRETVFFGPGAWVQARRQEWMDRISAFATSLGLDVELRQALDPFFEGGVSRGRRLLQQLKQLKYELSVSVGADGSRLAISSFNLHEAFFARRFEYAMNDGSDASSGCVAFGLERWALALATQLGPEEAFRLVEGELA